MALSVQCVDCESCANDRGGSLKVSGPSEPPWLDAVLCVFDSGRIPWYKAVSLRSLCSHTRDALYFSPRMGRWGWGRRGGGNSMLAACFMHHYSCFYTVIFFRKVCIKRTWLWNNSQIYDLWTIYCQWMHHRDPCFTLCGMPFELGNMEENLHKYYFLMNGDAQYTVYLLFIL